MKFFDSNSSTAGALYGLLSEELGEELHPAFLANLAEDIIMRGTFDGDARSAITGREAAMIEQCRDAVVGRKAA